MSLRPVRTIEIPGSDGSAFDHGAFEPKTERVFVAHTARHRLDVIDHGTFRHIATRDGFPEAAGVVAADGSVLVTNRGSASLAWVDAQTLETNRVFETGPRPNGVAFVAHSLLAVIACIGDDATGPELQVLELKTGRRWLLRLPGRPRWCVTDAAGTCVFLAIREPSMVLVASLPDLQDVHPWPLPVAGAHGIDIDHRSGRLYVACDAGALVEVDVASGTAGELWPLPGAPDATFFNPSSGFVYVAVEEPGVIQSVNPRTGATMSLTTAQGAKTTAFVNPNYLYVFSPRHRGALVLADDGEADTASGGVSREF
jgi:DNA-binding beta-propeller fold protein YncE